MAANPARGETEITLGGEPLVLRPTFDALSKLEGEFDKSVFSIITDMARPAGLQVRIVAAVIHACALAAGNKISRDEVGTKVMKDGLTNHALALVEFLSKALGLDKEATTTQGNG